MPTSTNPIAQPFGIALTTLSPIQIFLSISLIILFIWILFTAIFIYHWVRYDKKSLLAIPLFATHFAISFLLFTIASTGFFLSH